MKETLLTSIEERFQAVQKISNLFRVFCL